MRRCERSDHSCRAAGRQAQQPGVQQRQRQQPVIFWHFAPGTYNFLQVGLPAQQQATVDSLRPPTGSAMPYNKAMPAGGQLGRARTGTSAALSRKRADASTQKPHKNAGLQQCTSTALAGLRAVLHLRPPPAARSRSRPTHTPHGCAPPRLRSSSMLAHRPQVPLRRQTHSMPLAC